MILQDTALDSDVKENWTLSKQDLIFINKKSVQHRYVFALKLKFFEHNGFSLKTLSGIVNTVKDYLSEQVQGTYITDNYFKSRTCRDHNRDIRKYFAFTLMIKKDQENLKTWLWNTQFPLALSTQQMSAKTFQYLYKARIEAQSRVQIENYLNLWSFQFEIDFFKMIGERLSQASQKRLDSLLKGTQVLHNEDELGGEREVFSINLNDLKQDPRKASVKAIDSEMKRLNFIQVTQILNASFFQDVSFPLIKKYHDFVVTLLPSELLRYGKKSPQKKYALLACFCYVKGVQFIDNLIDILLSLTHKIVNRAKKKAKSDFWRDRRVIYNKDIVLRGVATVSIDYPRGIIEEKIYPKVGRQDTLEKIVQAPENFDDYYMKKRYHYMQLSYVRHYRRMISPILKNIEICSKNIKNHKILSSLALIKKYLDSKDTYYPKDETIPDIVPKGAKVAVIEENDSGTRVHKAKYELALLKILRTRLRCKDMWAEGAFKYRDPDKDLPQDFLQDKERYYKEIQKPRSAEKFISDLKETLNYWLVKLNQNIPRNKKVRITTRGHKPWIKLSPSKAQKTPPNIDRLRQDILMRWPHISLLDVLKEVELRLDITSVFESLARTERIPKHELQYKIILCLFALATNTGLKRVSAHMPDVSYDDLKYIQKRFINKDNLRNAIRKVINGNLAIRDKDLFGGVTISCACDSTKFRAWDQNLMTEWHVRYRGPGIMVYWHVDRKSLCVYSQLKTCSSSEIVSMIEGIINHATRADVKKSYVDSNGQSLVAFAFSDLLDFSLLPRLKRIGEERLLFPESRPQDLKNIESLFIRAANWNLVEENYDPMIQSAVVLKLKITEPESLLKRFTSNNLQHPVYQALQELGRIKKSIFICQYLCSEELRQEIHEGLNVIENWNSVNDFIYYGKKSTIASNERSTQELSMLSLHLLQSSLVYLNTLMIQKVLDSKDWQNRLTVEDKRALSPLFYAHINPYGTFKLDMQERIAI